MNKHLERLGYRKKANRSYDIEAKKIASEAVKIFISFCITSKRKDGKDGIRFMKLFNLEAEKKFLKKTPLSSARENKVIRMRDVIAAV